MIDVNVSLSHWPFRRLPLDQTQTLVAALKREKIHQAWAGSFDGILHRDVAAVNERLASECKPHDMLVPFGTVNPSLPDWRDDLRRCHEIHKMPGIRLHPNYHSYTLDDPKFAQLLDEAAARAMIVQLAVTMEDERTQHPLVRGPPVDLKPLAALIAGRSKVRIVLLNAMGVLRGAPLKTLLNTGRVWVETATLEAVAGIEHFVANYGAKRLLIGSHAPFFCVGAAQLKLQESILSEQDAASITEGNAQMLLKSP